MSDENDITYTTDESEVPTPSAPDRSTGDTTGELQRAGGEAATDVRFGPRPQHR